MFKKLILFVVSLVSVNTINAQIIDKVIGVVGKYSILYSDLQTLMIEQQKSGLGIDKCKAYETLVYQKLLLAQADRDSVVVNDQEVDQELSKRLNYFIQQFGSEEKLEQFYGKRTNVIKDEMRSDVQEQLVAQKMSSKITGDGKITPAEVRAFYKTIPVDSLPLINSEVELSQIVRKPQYSTEEKNATKDKLEGYRQRVISGESSIALLARLYSEDPGSAKEGGLIENVGKGQMVPEFEGVAFKLKEGEVSKVFETAYGYHFIQLVKRKGEVVDLRHILLMPKISNADFFKCKKELDTILTSINQGKYSFEIAVKKFSDDKDTKLNSGIMINQRTASTKFDNEDLSVMDQNLVPALNGMKVEDITPAMQYTTPDGKPAYRIVKLKNRIDPHKANLKDDYQKISSIAVAHQNKNAVKNWIKRRSAITYIKLDDEYKCQFENDWTINNN
jgi:peptidyl-prolyl cis-trans isomerase SurA